jgi:hypothetical protein
VGLKNGYMTSTSWGFRSPSYWLVVLTSLGIIFIGARFIVDPTGGAHGFGIDLAETAYGRIKGIRDIYTGVGILVLAALRLRRAAGWVYASAIIIPLTDGLVVLHANGWHDIAHLSIHWGTALGMVFISLGVLLPTWKHSFGPSNISSL